MFILRRAPKKKDSENESQSSLGSSLNDARLTGFSEPYVKHRENKRVSDMRLRLTHLFTLNINATIDVSRQNINKEMRFFLFN